jgi:hypothetical protein
MLHPDLKALVGRLTRPALEGRCEATRIRIVKCRAEAIAAGRTGWPDYPSAIMNLCLHDINASVDTLWRGYREAVTNSRLPWTDELRTFVVAEIEEMLTTDIPYIEGLARDAIVGWGHGFELFLTKARPGILDRVTTEMELLAIRYRPIGGTLLDQLSAPRYAGPATHWREVVMAAQAESPDRIVAAREAVLAAEAVGKVVSGHHSATLGQCIDKLTKSGRLSAVLAQGPQALWNIANTTPGLRHAGPGVPDVPGHVAEYVVALSEGAIRIFLGIDLPSVKHVAG